MSGTLSESFEHAGKCADGHLLLGIARASLTVIVGNWPYKDIWLFKHLIRSEFLLLRIQ